MYLSSRPCRSSDWRTGNRSLPVGVSCSCEQRIRPTCFAGSAVPAGAMEEGTSITYLMMGFPVSSLSSASWARASEAVARRIAVNDIDFITIAAFLAPLALDRPGGLSYKNNHFLDEIPFAQRKPIVSLRS